MRLSSLADYAVVMMAAAARHGVGARLSATALAIETGVPLPTAQKLVGRLSAASLVETSRGAGGGFVVARGADAISLADIVEAVDGPIALTACVEDGRHDCALEPACPVKPHWPMVNAAVRDAFARITLEDLAHPVRAEPVEALSISSAERHGASTSPARTALGAL